MTLPADSKEINLRLSLNKFHVDNLETTESLNLVFDTGLDTVEGWTRWVVVNLESVDPYSTELPEIVWTIFCCTTEDPGWVDNSRLKDTVMNYLVDPLRANGMKTVPLYDTSVSPWTVVGHLMIDRIDPGPKFKGEQTKISPLTIRARWATSI